MNRANSSRPTAIDLYAGAGGFSLGLEQAGFDMVLAIDRDPYHVATHRRNFPHTKVVRASVRDLKTKHLRKLLGEHRSIDLISGGPPCQGFSSMGKRYHADPRNTLVDDFVRIVLALKPNAFLMENVPSMQVGATAAVLNRAIKRLGARYRITTPVRTLNAANFGVPQRRERLFVMGILKEFDVEIRYPIGPCPQQPARPTVWQAIADLPSLIDREDLFNKDDAEYRRVDDVSPYAQALRGMKVDPCDLSYPRAWDSTKVSGCLRIRHRADIEQLYAATAAGASVPAHNLPRLHPDGLAPTLRAGTDSEHGSYNAPRPVHPFEPRCITVREAARLHGYPDWFKFYPAKWHAHRQIGNSVSPPIARALGTAIIGALGVKPEKPTIAFRLMDDFTLESGSIKHHARIPQIEEFPKVLEYLVKKAKPGRRLRKPEFTVDDVKRAFIATKARMPRTPPDRFLQDLARSRNRYWLLAPVRDAKLAIQLVGENGTYGRFVPLKTDGALDDKNFLAFSSEEVVAATPIKPLEKASLDDASLATYLTKSTVARSILGVGSIRFADGKVERGRLIAPFEIVSKGVCLRRGVAVVVNRGELPVRSSLASMMKRAECGTAVVIAQLTAEHFAVLLARLKDGRAVEKRRAVFRVQPGAQARLPLTSEATRATRSASN